VLLGEAPGAVTALIDPPASIPLAPGVGSPIPAQVIARRPDVAAAERALAEGESEANLAWMRQVQNELFSIEGAEAETDGISGRMAG